MSSAGPGLAVLVGALVIGCGGGSVASIPPVAPVVAPSPDNDLMQEMGGESEPAAPAGDEATDEPEPEKPEAAAEPAKPEAKPAAKPPAKPAPKQP
jgi:hypothetical protein